jgi:integrase
MKPNNKRRLTVSYVEKLEPSEKTFLVWDGFQRGLALSVSPTGRKTWLVVYSFRGRARWYTIAAADAISLPAARQLAAEIMLEVIKGGDPQAEKIAKRNLEDLDGPQPLLKADPQAAMRSICKALKAERATPHDLRRTFGTMVTKMGFGRVAMDRVLNHKDQGIGSVYDRHGYSEENMKLMNAVASEILALATGEKEDNVIRFAKSTKQA